MDHLPDIFDDLGKIDLLFKQDHLLSIHFAHIENIIDQTHQVSAAFIDFLDVIVKSLGPINHIGVGFR